MFFILLVFGRWAIKEECMSYERIVRIQFKILTMMLIVCFKLRLTSESDKTAFALSFWMVGWLAECPFSCGELGVAEDVLMLNIHKTNLT